MIHFACGNFPRILGLQSKGKGWQLWNWEKSGGARAPPAPPVSPPLRVYLQWNDIGYIPSVKDVSSLKPRGYDVAKGFKGVFFYHGILLCCQQKETKFVTVCMKLQTKPYLLTQATCSEANLNLITTTYQ